MKGIAIIVLIIIVVNFAGLLDTEYGNTEYGLLDKYGDLKNVALPVV